MDPRYVNEVRYSHLIAFPDSANESDSSVAGTAQAQFDQAQAHLHREEYGLALASFRELSTTILRWLRPSFTGGGVKIFPHSKDLVTELVGLSSRMVNVLPGPAPTRPPVEPVTVAPGVASMLDALGASALSVTSFQSAVTPTLVAAQQRAQVEDWSGALQLYDQALGQVPADQVAVRAALTQDMALLTEKSGDAAGAVDLATRAVDLAGNTDATTRLASIDVAAGIAQRAGHPDLATTFSTQAQSIRATNNLNVLVAATPLARAGLFTRLFPTDAAPARVAPAPVNTGIVPPTDFVESPVLTAGDVVAAAPASKVLTVFGTSAELTVTLDDPTSITTMFEKYRVSDDLGLVTKYLVDPTVRIAFLPHLYSYAIPMAIGDCLVGLGDLSGAIASYASVLTDPYLNQAVEVPAVWLRLAQTILDSGDIAYREAHDDVTAYATARDLYQQIVTTAGAVPAGGPLYGDAQFAPMATRVQSFLAAADPTTHDDNPALGSIVLQARSRLAQIQSGLNFFGFSPEYVPPFGFDYLQTTARYFAQQASQIEQRYIQFKSQAENAQLQRDQLAQQAEVARQSVVLEQRGVDEAVRGVAAANASVGYAQTQLDNANQAKQDFQGARWELLELTEAEAWSSAAAMDSDDEVSQTWNGNYYSAKNKNRSQVLQDLAYRRARLSQDLESNRLNREAASAASYLSVANAQRAQAQARVEVARQRVAIAALQQRQAEQNRDFLDLADFGAQRWYDLAILAGRLRRRYLDMATEMAFLTERAYNAETGRGVHVVQYDYERTEAGNLLGGDLLLADLDYFTYDHLTTTRTRKQPIKTTISLADRYPASFDTFTRTGRCLFETTLADFDRAMPGLYLAKLRNVELVFVGVTSATGISGTLRNIGVSKFRDATGAEVDRLYPADVLMLSQFDLRTDALVLPVSPNDLRLFENNGVATAWQLDLPPGANDLDYSQILDVHLVLYADGFVDADLEKSVTASLPTTGSASRVVSLALSYPEELFYLLNQGTAELRLDPSMFPTSQTGLTCTRALLRLSGPGAAQARVRLTSPAIGAQPLDLTLDGDGQAALAAWVGKPLAQALTIDLDPAANPGLVTDGVLDPSKVGDVQLFVEYSFTYR